MLALTATLFVVWYTNDNPGATVVGWTWTVAETALALVMAAILMRFFIAQVAAAWVGVTTTLQELEVQQIELTQARQLLREVGDVARNTATVQREAMGLAREQARLGEDTLRLRREVQDGQTQLRAERENVRSIEESPGVKAAHRYIPSVPSTPGMSSTGKGLCYEFHGKGTCRRGKSCRFSHATGGGASSTPGGIFGAGFIGVQKRAKFNLWYMTLFATLFLGGTTEIAGLGGITSELLAELPHATVADVSLNGLSWPLTGIEKRWRHGTRMLRESQFTVDRWEQRVTVTTQGDTLVMSGRFMLVTNLASMTFTTAGHEYTVYALHAPRDRSDFEFPKYVVFNAGQVQSFKRTWLLSCGTSRVKRNDVGNTTEFGSCNVAADSGQPPWEGAAAAAYAHHKETYLATAQTCERQGILFLPMVVETTGNWDARAYKALRHIAQGVASRTGTDHATTLSTLLQEAKVVVRGFRARAALRRRAELASQ